MRWARAGVEELSSGLSSIAKSLLSRLAVWSRKAHDSGLAR